MTAARANMVPAVGFQLFDDFPDFHAESSTGSSCGDWLGTLPAAAGPALPWPSRLITAGYHTSANGCAPRAIWGARPRSFPSDRRRPAGGLSTRRVLAVASALAVLIAAVGGLMLANVLGVSSEVATASVSCAAATAKELLSMAAGGEALLPIPCFILSAP